jgi:periodic tryptophan protein 1
MISALAWVPKGKLKSSPEKYQITKEDISALKGTVMGDDEDIDEEQLNNTIEAARQVKEKKKVYDDAALFEDDKDFDDMNEEELLAGENDFADPVEEDDLDEIDDLTIRPTDCIVLGAAAKSEDDEDLSRLEVHVFEESSKNLYLHHDVMLTSFPLCITYIDRGVGETAGNFAAIGGFEPAIDLWDLDVMDVMAPSAVLGGYAEEGTKGKKSKKKQQFKAGSHTGAIMALSWNTAAKNILGSGSADTTVKIWDLNTAQCISSLSHHSKEVQSVEWHPKEATIMVSGSFDKTVQLLDVRANDRNSYLVWNIPHDCECIQWNPINPQFFVVGTESGSIYCYDVMKGGKSAPIWTISAHSKAASTVSINPLVPMLVSGSVDKSLKVFDISGEKPKLLENIKMQFGVFSSSFYSDVPNLLAVGSEHNGMRVIDLAKYESVVNAFQHGNNATKQEAAPSGGDDAMMDADEDEDEDEDSETTPTTKQKDKKKKKKKSNNNKYKRR